MATREVAAVNIGKVVRDGLQLKSQEAVALVYEACARLETGVVGRLPASIDELSVTNAGVVKLPSGGEPQLIHTAAAGLLESLLGAVNEETEPIPSVLRSLPARLGSAATDKSPAVRDLLSVLRWHLRLDPRQVLQELVARAASAEGKAASAEGKHESAAVAYEIPLRDAAGEIAPQDLDLSTAGLSAVESIPAGATPAARPRLTSRWAVAAAAMVALSLSAYAGYRYTSRHGPARPPTTAAIAPPPIIGPRVTPDFVRGEPQPLQLPVTGGAFSPSFTAEPRTLLFHAGHNTAGRLYTAMLDDRGFPSDVTPLFDEPARNYHARLSPDGRWVAFDSDRDGERGVYIADRSGTSMSRVNGEGFGAVPSWSPDMKSLAFIRSEPGRPRVWNLWIRYSRHWRAVAGDELPIRPGVGRVVVP